MKYLCSGWGRGLGILGLQYLPFSSIFDQHWSGPGISFKWFDLSSSPLCAYKYKVFLLFFISVTVHKIVISQWIYSSGPSLLSEIKPLQGYITGNNRQFVFFPLQALNLFIEKLICSIFENFHDSGEIMNSCYHWHKTATLCIRSLLKTQKIDITCQRSILDV